MKSGKTALGRSSSCDCDYVKSKSVLIKIPVIAVKSFSFHPNGSSIVQGVNMTVIDINR